MKEKIKKAAINLFYKKGYFATSMSSVANATGIRKASIYHHYSTKEDILLDIFIKTMADLQDNLQKRLDEATGAREKLKAVVYSHIIFHVERQKEVVIADSELRGLTSRNYKEVIQMRDDYEKVIQDVLAEGVSEDSDAGCEHLPVRHETFQR